MPGHVRLRSRTASSPGSSGYEAGQSCVGDSFAWFVEHGVPAAYRRGGRERPARISTRYLRSKAAQLEPGKSGLLALDWWNGNRTILVDADLTGVLLGATLATTPEEIYRALIEATAYGTRVIIDTFEANGVPINEIVASGGLPERTALDHADLRRRRPAARSGVSASDQRRRSARRCSARSRPGRGRRL